MNETILPFDRETEEAVLGAVLIDPDFIIDVSLMLKPSDFYMGHHQQIYKAMLKLFRAEMNLDVLTIEQAMGEHANDETLPFLVGLVSSVPSLSGMIGYAKVVKAHSLRRQLIQTASKIATEAHNTSRPIDAVIQETEQRLIELVQDRHNTGLEHIGDVAELALADSEAEANGADTTIKTGLTDLDSMTRGLQRSDLVLLAARPGMGKTAMQLQIALNAARNERRRIAIFSLEMGKRQLSWRLVSQMTGIPYQRIQSGNLSQNEWPRYYEAIATLKSFQMYVDDTANMTPLQMRSKCRQLAASRGLDLVMVDYAQLMQPDGKHGNKTSEGTEISRALKLLARELDVPVLAAAQLNRGVENRADKRPMLSDLRDSGSYEQDADQVWMMYRDDYYEKEMSERPNETEILLRKNRRGQTGTVSLYWHAESMGFADLARESIL